jgi:Leucine rich repeat
MNCFYLSDLLKEIPGSVEYYSQSTAALTFEKTTYSNKNLTASDLAMLIHDQKNQLSIHDLQAATNTLEHLTHKIETKKKASLWQKIKQIWLTSLDNSSKKRGFTDSLTLIQTVKQEVQQAVDDKIKAAFVSENRLTLESLPQNHLIDIIHYLPYPFVLERVSKAFKQIISINLPQRFIAIAKQNEPIRFLVQRALKSLPLQVTPKEQHQAICKPIIKKLNNRPAERINTYILKTKEYLLDVNQINQLIEWHQATQLIALFSRLTKDNQGAKDLYNQFKYSLEIIKSSVFFEIDVAKKMRKFLKITPLNLTFLDLSQLDLSDLPPEIGCFTQLKTLNLKHNQLVELPDQIGLLTQLEKLSLASNRLEQLPAIFNKLSHLDKLDLYQNRLEKLPKSVKQLTSLRTLYIHENLIPRLPSIRNLSNLEYFSFKNGFLKRVPRNFEKLTKLKEIDLSHNELKQLLRIDKIKHVIEKPFLCSLKPVQTSIRSP